MQDPEIDLDAEAYLEGYRHGFHEAEHRHSKTMIDSEREHYDLGYEDGIADREIEVVTEDRLKDQLKYATDAYTAGHITLEELRQWIDNVLNGTVR